MKVRVYLLAFGYPGEIREVEIPDSYDPLDPGTLETIFWYGQNEVQPQNHPSCSVGDVIELGGYWLIQNVGFKELTSQEFEEYKELPQVEKLKIC